jgi:hypothetical protein
MPKNYRSTVRKLIKRHNQSVGNPELFHNQIIFKPTHWKKENINRFRTNESLIPRIDQSTGDPNSVIIRTVLTSDNSRKIIPYNELNTHDLLHNRKKLNSLIQQEIMKSTLDIGNTDEELSLHTLIAVHNLTIDLIYADLLQLKTLTNGVTNGKQRFEKKEHYLWWVLPTLQIGRSDMFQTMITEYNYITFLENINLERWIDCLTIIFDYNSRILPKIDHYRYNTFLELWNEFIPNIISVDIPKIYHIIEEVKEKNMGLKGICLEIKEGLKHMPYGNEKMNNLSYNVNLLQDKLLLPNITFEKRQFITEKLEQLTTVMEYINTFKQHYSMYKYNKDYIKTKLHYITLLEKLCRIVNQSKPI